MAAVVVLAAGLGAAALAQGGAEVAPHRSWWKGVAVWMVAAGAATVADVGLSRACIARYAGCREANPLLRNGGTEVAVEAGAMAGVTLWSVHLRKRNKRWWRLPLVALTAAHAVGAASAWRGARALGRHP